MTERHPLYYDSLDDYNADVVAAREAYWRDENVREGFCETGCGRAKDGAARRCRRCRKGGGKP